MIESMMTTVASDGHNTQEVKVSESIRYWHERRVHVVRIKAEVRLGMFAKLPPRDNTSAHYGWESRHLFLVYKQ